MGGSSEAGPCVNFIVVFYKPSINLRIYTVTFVIQVTFTVYIIVFDFFSLYHTALNIYNLRSKEVRALCKMLINTECKQIS